MPYREAVVLHKVLTELHIGMLFLALLAGIVAAVAPRGAGRRTVAQICDSTFVAAAIGGTLFLVLSALTGFLAWPWDRLWRTPVVYGKVSFSALALALWTTLIAARLKSGGRLWERRSTAAAAAVGAVLAFAAVAMAASAGGHLGHGVSLFDGLFLGFNPYVPIVWAPWFSVGVIVSGACFIGQQIFRKESQSMTIFSYTMLIVLFAGSAGVTRLVWSESPAAPGRIAQRAQHGAGSGHAGSTPEKNMGSDMHKGHGAPDHPMQASPQTKLKPAEGASVKILAPQAGQSFKGDQVPIHFSFTKGKRGHHIHAYVDGELMGMFASEKGTLTGIQPGRHTLELRVVAEDHQTELDAVDRIEFMVK